MAAILMLIDSGFDVRSECESGRVLARPIDVHNGK